MAAGGGFSAANRAGSLPNVNQIGQQSPLQQQQQQQQQPQQSPYSDYSSDQALLDYYAHPRHQLAKRSLAAQSAVHRFEIFSCIERSLDQ